MIQWNIFKGQLWSLLKFLKCQPFGVGHSCAVSVLLLGNYARWVCHKMWLFCKNVVQDPGRKHFVVRQDLTAFTRPYSKLGFRVGGTAEQRFRLRAHLREVLINAALTVTNVGQSCGIIWPSMFLIAFFTHIWLSQHWRLAHRKDCLDKKLYPLLTHKHRVPTQKCSVCYVFIGRSVKASKAS